MSHHGHGYRVYPDDMSEHTHEEWSKADSWINGLEFRKDFNEALALAKLGAVNCQFPFIVMEIPIGGKRQRFCDCWVIEP
jgi:hypothetical protein